jgi:glutathione peroxidase
MRTLLAAAVGLFALSATAAEKPVPPALNFKMNSIDGSPVDLSKYQGKVVMFVNVASKCGNTPQYKELQEMHEKYGPQGLAIVGVPANEFGKQEPGTDAQIKEFCTSKYKVTFDMLSKVVVKGEGICPLYKFLTSKDTDPQFAGDVSWNFEKFLVGKDGQVIGRFKPKMKPNDPAVTAAVETALKQ